MASRDILKAAKWRMQEEARKVLPIDEEATIDREAVYAAVRSAGAKHIAERPPNLGRMSDAEFREYKSQFGF